MKRLALFWLVCVATGFAVAAGAAVLLALTVDGNAAMRRSATDTASQVLELRPMPGNAPKSPLPYDVGHQRLIDR